MERSSLSELLADLTRRLRDAYQSGQIYLYGSYVYGTPGPDSDLDVVVIIPESDESFFARAARGYRALRGFPLAVDLQVYTDSEFEERAALPISFERTVKSKGRRLEAA